MFEIDRLAYAYPGSNTGFTFDLEVEAGEIIGLVGPSGSGKSTLFDLVAGFLKPASGDIRLDGRSILDKPPEARPVSILFQSDNVFEHLTASANVALGTRRDASAVGAALEEMGLGGMAQRRAADLSGGQKQRVALARTLLRDQPILLLDEPFTGLDQETLLPIRDLIARMVRDKGWHAIIVSHQGEEIAALAKRVYRIKNGRTLRV